MVDPEPMREPVQVAIEEYLARETVPGEDARRLRALAARRDPWSRDTPLHFTASALVLHPASRRVLLRWHERMGRWMQVGGHADPGESDPLEIALREAREESGLDDLHPAHPGPMRPAQVVVVGVPALGDEPAHEHADIRYVLVTDHPDDITPEAPAAALQWVSMDEARRSVDGDDLRRLVERAGGALTSR